MLAGCAGVEQKGREAWVTRDQWSIYDTTDSYAVAKYLIDYGFDVIPVNPTVSAVLGRRSFPSVTDIPGSAVGM